LFNFDDLTPNSTFSPAQYSAQEISIASPEGLEVAPFSTQSSLNELFDKSADGSANITIGTPATSQLGIGIADSGGVTIKLQPLSASGASLGSPLASRLQRPAPIQARATSWSPIRPTNFMAYKSYNALGARPIPAWPSTITG